ncbi:MAG: hypothetical protein ACFE8G_15820 [Candidatus Hermodarchaeota archaeon]
MKKLDKFLFLVLIIFITSISSIFIFTVFIKDQELIDFFASFTLFCVLISVFSFFGYLIIKRKKYARNQKIILILLLVIIGFIDILLLIVATVSGLWIYSPILGIFNSISLGIYAIILGAIESKSLKKKS